MEELELTTIRGFEELKPEILAIVSKKKSISIYSSDPAKRYELGCLFNLCFCQSFWEDKCRCESEKESCECDSYEHSCDEYCSGDSPCASHCGCAGMGTGGGFGGGH